MHASGLVMDWDVGKRIAFLTLNCCGDTTSYLVGVPVRYHLRQERFSPPPARPLLARHTLW